MFLRKTGFTTNLTSEINFWQIYLFVRVYVVADTPVLKLSRAENNFFGELIYLPEFIFCEKPVLKLNSAKE